MSSLRGTTNGSSRGNSDDRRRGVKTDPLDFGGGRPPGRPAYSAAGIRRLLCARAGCGRKAHATWGACADGNINRPLCPECDFELNARVLTWFGDPQAEDKLWTYREKLEADIGRPLEPFPGAPDAL